MSGPTPTPGSPEPAGERQPSETPAAGTSDGSASQPLGANASMADILARMRAMGADPTGVGTDASAAADSGAAAAPPVGWTAPTPPPPRKPRSRLLAGLAGLFAVLVGIGAKVLLGVAVVGVGGQVLGALFGGPFERLPQSTRDGFEQRLNTALGPDSSKLSEQDYADRYNALLVDGLSRLPDDKLVSEAKVLAEMFDRADTATCAEAARSEWSTTGSTFEVSDKMWGLLSQDELTGHIETQVEAVEAAAAKSPAQVTVTADHARTAVQSVFSAIGDGQNAILDDLAQGTTHSDAEACGAVKAFHDAEVALPPTDLALVARFTASP